MERAAVLKPGKQPNTGSNSALLLPGPCISHKRGLPESIETHPLCSILQSHTDQQMKNSWDRAADSSAQSILQWEFHTRCLRADQDTVATNHWLGFFLVGSLLCPGICAPPKWPQPQNTHSCLWAHPWASVRIICFTLSFFSPQCFSSPKRCWGRTTGSIPGWKRGKPQTHGRESSHPNIPGLCWKEDRKGHLPDRRSAPGTPAPWTHSHSWSLHSVPLGVRAAARERGREKSSVRG